MPDTPPVENTLDDVVAIVIMRSASGETPDGQVQITTETLERFKAAPDSAQKLHRVFDDAGLSIGPAVGISMSLSGTQAQFESFFNTTLTPDGQGGWQVEHEGSAEQSRNLPLDALPAATAELLYAVVFEPPIELDEQEMSLDGGSTK